MTDWASLNQQAAAFTSLTSSTDPVTGAVSVIFSGLEVKLSEVVAQARGKTISSITIYADTLTADVPAVNVEGLTVVARSIDASALADGCLEITNPASGTAVVEVLVGEFVHGSLALAPTSAAAGQSPLTVPAGTSPPCALLYTVSPDGSAVGKTLTDAAYLQDLLGRAWALLSLKASYTAAARLMNGPSADDKSVAQSMFNWIVACVGTLGVHGATIPPDAVELYNQAGALLVTLNVAPGGYFIPTLSNDMYQTQIQTLLGALAGYEAGLRTLSVETDIAAAVASVSSTLQGTSEDEIAPLRTQLRNVQDNISSLYQSVVVLRSNFFLQADQANTDYLNLAAAVALEKLAQFLQDSISTTMSVVSMGVAVAKGSQGDVGSVSDGMNSLSGGITSGLKALDDLQWTPPAGEGLVQQAKQLMHMQQALMTSFQAATILWSQSQQGSSGDALPSSLAVVDIDPSLAWDNYLIQAQAVLTGVKEQIGSGTDAQKAQDGANAYLASLQILGGYGKAIDGKFEAYSSQTAQATLINAQIAAAQSVVARWQAQEQEAKSDQERLALLSSILQSRADALKRSIYVAWTYYRASYFYVHLVEPPAAVDLSMTSAQMKDVFSSVSAWVAELLGTAPDGQHVVLPNNDVDIDFDFIIRTAGDSSELPAGAEVALLTPHTDGNSAELVWTVPLGDAQLSGVLPNKGDVAIWITSLELEIDGVRPNAKGNVLVKVSTSGTYQNGFGPSNAYNFFGKGLSGDYGYSPQTNHAYIPWEIPTAVYMKPTPYTQWNLSFYPDGGDPSQATELHMKLKVAYLSPTSPASARNRLSQPARATASAA